MAVDIEIVGKPSINFPDEILGIIYDHFLENINEISKGEQGHPICLIITEKGYFSLPFAPRDIPHKQFLKASIHSLCIETSATHIAFIVDTWISKRKTDSERIAPRDDPDRMEAVSVFFNDYRGYGCMLAAFYERSGDKINFENIAKWVSAPDFHSSMIGPWERTISEPK